MRFVNTSAFYQYQSSWNTENRTRISDLVCSQELLMRQLFNHRDVDLLFDWRYHLSAGGTWDLSGSNLRGGSMRLWPTPPRLVACFLIAALLSLADTITAQTTSSGGLTGVVTDQSNAVVLSAEVDINNNARGVTESTKTDL